jgi:hypothetical protein
MKALGILTHKKLAGVKRVGTSNWAMYTQTKKNHPSKTPMWKVSPETDAYLRAWWANAVAMGDLGVSSLVEGFDFIGDKKWPDMVHVGAVAQSAGRGREKTLSKQEMGAWLVAMGLEKQSKTVHRRNHRGKVVYTTIRVFYVVSAFRTG